MTTSLNLNSHRQIMLQRKENIKIGQVVRKIPCTHLDIRSMSCHIITVFFKVFSSNYRIFCQNWQSYVKSVGFPEKEIKHFEIFVWCKVIPQNNIQQTVFILIFHLITWMPPCSLNFQPRSQEVKYCFCDSLYRT